VRAFEVGIQLKLGLDPTTLTKVQTGGPDGDLGSNEILMSCAAGERTLAVVDGSGVLCDPDGLDAGELTRLAKGRKMVSAFDAAKLGGRGFLVRVEDTDVKLPSGVVVPSGLSFRNNFHLNPAARGHFFVPCGGRPGAVQVENVEAFLYGGVADGSSNAAGPAPEGEGKGAAREPRFKYIVEGANVFFSNDARLALEARGVVLFKDASANKGGVTSSSLEVLAALALTDDEFTQHMCCAGGGGHGSSGGAGAQAVPAFYQAYVAEVQALIEQNAALEFECLWRERGRTGQPLSSLSDTLSTRITQLSARIEGSDSLWANASLRQRVLRDAVPRTLAGLVGGADVILKRLPDNYTRALFGSRLASRFIYAAGLTTPEFAFWEYVDGIMKKTAAAAAGAQ
jgi:glutamate dehydrogenase